MHVSQRKVEPRKVLALAAEGAPLLLARLWAARGVAKLAEARADAAQLLPVSELLGASQMAVKLADAIEHGKRLLVVADYDADGATACAVAVRGLRGLGAHVDYVIPHRLEHSYGLTPEIIRTALQSRSERPDYLITVDNGIAANAGVDYSNQLGIPVLITDHHLPGDTPPAAECIVNPNQHGCAFPSKNLAGCGVMYYVICALDAELRARGLAPNFDVTQLLPLVAVGTIADVVWLDVNNRILVSEGLARIRAGTCPPGVAALARAAGKDLSSLTTTDIAFGLGPRINAAGRLDSMNVGVECLLTDDVDEARSLAERLSAINDQRKQIESDMVEEAVRALLVDVQPNRYTAVLHSADWHVGVIGIVAGRIKERIWRPTFVLAQAKDGSWKGSGRSIPGFHLRDALDVVSKRCPGVLLKFGGHAMAAGVTVAANSVPEFIAAFELVAQEKLTAADLAQELQTDGPLLAEDMALETIAVLGQEVWGQGFAEPLFSDEFYVDSAKPLGGGKHLKLSLRKDGRLYDAVRFRYSDGAPSGRIRAAYRLSANTFRDETRLQLLVEHFEAVEP